ncbi:addiction module protein [Argonema antarcticum]|uniref:addiction module protein n=1 Tax=Argonema antarcticum TaxID=2942763 RepID=UPI002010ED9C|nr:addiction module protein [Argonema antarcticum]MCL1475771.1 addiction module protein [Argonema antarcticum A004/B2]
MNLQELTNEASKLSVSDRLLLVEAIVQSLSREIRPCLPVPHDIVEQMSGLH